MSSEILTASNLAALSGINHGFFTKDWGNGGFSGQENLIDTMTSRSRMAEYLGVESQNLLSCAQIHSPDVVTVAELWTKETRPKADALVTNKPRIALGVLTADCVPVLFAEIGADVIGAAHAGWRGAIGGVVENTLDAMEKLGANRKKIHAALGPCIAQNSYEVGPEFPAPFLAENTQNEKFFHPAPAPYSDTGFKSDHYMFDLPGYVVAKLRALGVASVEPSPADTCADPQRFYSHRYSTLRGEKRAGSLMSAIMLVER